MNVIFDVNGEALDCGSIWYQYHNNPQIKGEVYPYIVTVPLNEEKVIRRIEQMIGVSIEDSELFVEVSLKHYKSSFNLIQYIIDESDCKEVEISWVFYNIKEVFMKKSSLIILGEAGKFQR